MFDEEGYRKLAVHVLARAVKDCQRRSAGLGSDDGRPSKQVHNRYLLYTAQAFLSEATHPRLLLWCAWLDVDPQRVCRMALKGLI